MRPVVKVSHHPVSLEQQKENLQQLARGKSKMAEAAQRLLKRLEGKHAD